MDYLPLGVHQENAVMGQADHSIQLDVLDKEFPVLVVDLFVECDDSFGITEQATNHPWLGEECDSLQPA
jgi:hypothetical protein